MDLDQDNLAQFSALLESVPKSFVSLHEAFRNASHYTPQTTVSELRRLINSFKLLRYSTPSAAVTVEVELKRIVAYVRYYFEALPLGEGLPSTELQHADDLMLLAGNAFVNLWKLTGDEGHLFNAVYLLEYALTKSTQSFLARLILIRIYRLLGEYLAGAGTMKA